MATSTPDLFDYACNVIETAYNESGIQSTLWNLCVDFINGDYSADTIIKLKSYFGLI